MRTQPVLMDEMASFDEAADEALHPLDLPVRVGRPDDEDEDELGLRALAECPEWVSRACWRRLQAA